MVGALSAKAAARIVLMRILDRDSRLDFIDDSSKSPALWRVETTCSQFSCYYYVGVLESLNANLFQVEPGCSGCTWFRLRNIVPLCTWQVSFIDAVSISSISQIHYFIVLEFFWLYWVWYWSSDGTRLTRARRYHPAHSFYQWQLHRTDNDWFDGNDTWQAHAQPLLLQLPPLASALPSIWNMLYRSELHPIDNWTCRLNCQVEHKDHTVIWHDLDMLNIRSCKFKTIGWHGSSENSIKLFEILAWITFFSGSDDGLLFSRDKSRDDSQHGLTNMMVCRRTGILGTIANSEMRRRLAWTNEVDRL